MSGGIKVFDEEEWLDGGLPFPRNKRELRAFQIFDTALQAAQTNNKDELSKNVNLAAQTAVGLSSISGIKYVVKRLDMLSKHPNSRKETAIYTADSIMRHAAHSANEVRRHYERYLSAHIKNLFKRALRVDSTRLHLAEKFLHKILVKWKLKGWFQAELDNLVQIVEQSAPSVQRPPGLQTQESTAAGSGAAERVGGDSPVQVDDDYAPDGGSTAFGAVGSGRSTGGMAVAGMCMGGATAKAGCPPTPVQPRFLGPRTVDVLSRVPATPVQFTSQAGFGSVAGTPAADFLMSVPATPNPFARVPATPNPHVRVPSTPNPHARVPATPIAPGIAAPFTPAAVPRTPMPVPSTPMPFAASSRVPSTPVPQMPRTPGGVEGVPVPSTPVPQVPPTPGLTGSQTRLPATPKGWVPATPGATAQPFTPAGRVPSTPFGAQPSTPGGFTQPFGSRAHAKPNVALDPSGQQSDSGQAPAGQHITGRGVAGPGTPGFLPIPGGDSAPLTPALPGRLGAASAPGTPGFSPTPSGAETPAPLLVGGAAEATTAEIGGGDSVAATATTAVAGAAAAPTTLSAEGATGAARGAAGPGPAVAEDAGNSAEPVPGQESLPGSANRTVGAAAVGAVLCSGGTQTHSSAYPVQPVPSEDFSPSHEPLLPGSVPSLLDPRASAVHVLSQPVPSEEFTPTTGTMAQGCGPQADLAGCPPQPRTEPSEDFTPSGHLREPPSRASATQLQDQSPPLQPVPSEGLLPGGEWAAPPAAPPPLPLAAMQSEPQGQLDNETTMEAATEVATEVFTDVPPGAAATNAASSSRPAEADPGSMPAPEAKRRRLVLVEGDEALSAPQPTTPVPST